MKYDYRYTLNWMETNAHRAKGVEVGRDLSYVYFQKTDSSEHGKLMENASGNYQEGEDPDCDGECGSSSSSGSSESSGSSSESSKSSSLSIKLSKLIESSSSSSKSSESSSLSSDYSSSSSSSNICGSDPSIDVTVTWTDGAVEKTVFGETWTAAENGATKSICPTIYACTTKYFTSGGDYNFRDKYERFYITTTYNTLFRMGAQIREQFQSPYTINSPLSFYTFCKNVDLIDDITHSWQRYYTTFFSFTDSYGTATTNDIIPTNFISSANIENNQFGFASDGDITIQWERGPGDWGCH